MPFRHDTLSLAPARYDTLSFVQIAVDLASESTVELAEVCVAGTGEMTASVSMTAVVAESAIAATGTGSAVVVVGGSVAEDSLAAVDSVSGAVAVGAAMDENAPAAVDAVGAGVAVVLVWSTSPNGLTLNGVAPESLDPAVTLDLADFVLDTPSGTAPTKSSVSYQTTVHPNDTVRIVLSNPVYEPDGAGITIDVAAGAVEDLAGNPNAAVTGGAVTNGSTVWPVLWAFDAGSVQTSAGNVTQLDDITGGGNHATTAGDDPSLDVVTFSDACIFFDGSEILQVPVAVTSALTLAVNQPVTIGWSFYATAASAGLVFIGNRTANYQIAFRQAGSGDRLLALRRGTGGLVSLNANSSSFPLNTWHSATLVAGAASAEFFKGSNVSSNVGSGALASSGTLDAATTEGRIGIGESSSFMNGYMRRGFIHNAELAGRPLAVMATWTHEGTLLM